MTSLAFALALAAAQPLGTAWVPVGQVSVGSWRLVETSSLHVGLRPAAFADDEKDGALEIGVGATLQITARVL